MGVAISPGRVEVMLYQGQITAVGIPASQEPVRDALMMCSTTVKAGGYVRDGTSDLGTVVWEPFLKVHPNSMLQPVFGLRVCEHVALVVYLFQQAGILIVRAHTADPADFIIPIHTKVKCFFCVHNAAKFSHCD